MNILDKPLETESDEKITNIQEINKNLETGDSKFEKLPKELLNKNYILEKNKILIPISENEDKINYLTITKDKDTRKQLTYLHGLEIKENNKEPYGIIQTIPTAKFLTIKDKVRDNELIKNLVNLELFEDKKQAKIFIDSLILEFNKHSIESILNNNYDLLATIPEDTKEIDDKFKLQKKEDYPEDVQKEAMKLNKEGLLFNNILYTVNINHEGDKNQILRDIHSTATLFIGEGKSAHKLDGGGTGEGKTDKRKKVLDNVPDQYVNKYRTVSKKNIFYDKDNLHPEKNIFDFDDFVDSEDNQDIIKVLADNNDRNKELKTVSKDRKAETLKIPPDSLVNLNRAKQSSDAEMLNRFFLDDIDFEEGHKSKVKAKILTNQIYGINNNLILENMNIINKCAFQQLIDKKMKIFNPYILFLDVNEVTNRNIIGYIAFIETNSFNSFYLRKKINNIVIGNFEDFNSIAKQISTESIKQNYKINGTQERIIDLIPVMTEEESINTQHKAIDNLEDVKKSVCTYESLAKEIGLDKKTIVNAINGIKDTTAISLVDAGFIERKPLQPERYRSMVFLYKTKNSIKLSNENSNITYMSYNENKLSFNDIDKKISLLIAFLSNLKILINTQLYICINNFSEKHKENLNSYDKICNFLNDFFEKYKNKFVEKTEDNFFTVEEIKFHFNTISKHENYYTYIHNPDIKKNKLDEKIKEKSLNTKQNINRLLENNLNNISNNRNSNRELRRHIHKEIYEILLNKGSLSKSNIIKNISIFDQDPDQNYYIISKEVDHLEDLTYIDKESKKYLRTDEFVDYYENNLKNLKGDFQ